MRNSVLAAAGAAALAIGSSAGAQPIGAPDAAPMQAGGWGADGWQSGPGMAPRGPGPMAAPDDGRMPPPGMAPYRPMPPSGDYKPVHPGQKLASRWSDPALTVRDWREWGLGQPGPGMHWIRYYDDAVLVDPKGRVVAADDGIDWDVPHDRSGPGGSYAAGGPPPMARGRGYPGGGYRAGGYPAAGYPGGGYAAGGYAGGNWRGPRPGTTVVHPDANTTVTTQVIAPPMPVGYGYGYGAGTIVSVSPTIVTTTTTTTTDRIVTRGVRRWSRPIPHGKLVRR